MGGILHAMRILVPTLGALFLAACATAPTPEAPSPTLPVTPLERVQGGGVFALTAAELIAYLGNPALQVREGASLKLQFRSRQCVLDAYLYAPPTVAGVQRVTHSEARLPSGADTDQAACISTIRASR